jgi:hypothetical protein
MTTSLSNNDSLKRFELAIDGELAAWVEYELGEDVIALNHTEVAPRFRRRGLAGDIVAFALVFAQQGSLRVVPNCSFVASFIERNSEYRSLVA